MDKEAILKSFVSEEYRNKYINRQTSYNDHVEFECPVCHKHYISTYGNRFKKDGRVKGTLLCKSCAASINRKTNSDPIKGDRFGSLTFIERTDDYVTSSGKRYIQYLCKCDCGNEMVVRKDHLLRGSTTRCKQCKTALLVDVALKRGEKTDVPIGTRFGNLVVLEKVYHKDKYDRSIQYYKCQCDCGNVLDICKHSLLSGVSTSCGCYGSRTKIGVLSIERGNKTDPEIGQHFGKLVVQKIIMPENGEERKVECRCDCGNIVNVRKSALLNGHTKSCGNCKREYPQWFIDRLIDPAQKQRAIDGVLTTPEKVLISCYCCGETIEVTVNSLINLTTLEQKRVGACRHCAHQTSLIEKEIKDYLLSLGLNDEQILMNSRSVIRGDSRNQYKELDFYLPEYNLAIEYNGSYYHSDTRKPKNYHEEKFYLCEEKGIKLISIFELDWRESRNKILDLIKYSILPKIKIPARKCVVEHISIEEAFNFYNKYHIQNKSILATINLGLFYNSELVAVMGFGSSSFHNRQIKEGDYELHRFVTKTGLTVVGGASKLLKHFEDNYHPKFLLSYSWNDWFNGEMYAKLGFTLTKKIHPDYYWYLDGDNINKRKCRLKYLRVAYPELFQEALDNNASNKEDYVMEKLGAIKIYRSGSKRWEKIYKNKEL